MRCKANLLNRYGLSAKASELDRGWLRSRWDSQPIGCSPVNQQLLQQATEA